MASFKSQAFQSLLRSRTPFIRSQQRRWAQVHDVRFLATHRDPNQVLEKYRSKLDQKAKQEGFSSIESLKEAHQEKIDKLRREASTVLTPEPPTPSQKPHATPPPPEAQSPAQSQVANAAKTASATGIKALSSYIDVEKVRALPAKEIEALWRLRFASNPTSICAVIPLETYQRINSAARQNPQFILPLPRTPGESQASEAAGKPEENTGADIHFLQWAFHPPASEPTAANSHTSTVIFTPLAAYKLHGAYAQPHTTITHHLDLAEEKGVVLMQGQVMPESGVSTAEATWLVSCVQRFYDFGGQASGRKGELLRAFTQGDVQNFKIEELMAEAEKL
ncbi:ATP11 protein-domain-containing protein [Aspergillus filifer]